MSHTILGPNYCWHCEEALSSRDRVSDVLNLCSSCYHDVTVELDGHRITQMAGDVAREICETTWTCTPDSIQQLEVLLSLVRHYGEKQERLAREMTGDPDLPW